MQQPTKSDVRACKYCRMPKYLLLKFRSSFYPLFSAASVALQSLKTQRFRIKLKDLHKQALN
ncbi:hypothetical protein, partial [Thiolapillus sp.]|uniref:hypothetical protein n=1 Tax=Thiolapillus sp. TaxID=2017437 RepID=UPI003AF93AD9